jgi:hypothetical protein
MCSGIEMIPFAIYILQEASGIPSTFFLRSILAGWIQGMYTVLEHMGDHNNKFIAVLSI